MALVQLSDLNPLSSPSQIILPDEMKNNKYRIIIGDALANLKKIPDETCRCCITSPPYWGLRDYGVPNQIGAEDTLEEYLVNLVNIFREIKRILTKDGTLWLNIGDTYTSGNRKWRANDKKNNSRGMRYRKPTPEGLKPKDIIGIPWHLAFELQKDGWYLRSDIIWHKPNCQPESVKDRPTRSHEYLFLLSKSEKYYYDYAAIMEEDQSKKGKRNRRTVWTIPTKPNPYPHIAMFNEALVSPCIMAGSATDDIVLDPFFGSGTVGVAALKIDRKIIGIELNPEYAKIAYNRIKDETLNDH